MDRVLLVTILFVLAVIGHELAHALVAVAWGYKLKKFYFGIPFEKELFGRKWTTNILKKQIGGVEFGISLLLLGGAVDFYQLEKAPFGKFFTVVIAGPLFNLVVGFIPLLFYYSLKDSLYIMGMIIQVVLASLWSFTAGGLPMDQISGPIGAVNTMASFAGDYSNGLLLVWIILNLAFFITNILPIPAIDGGQILMAAFVGIFGEKLRKPAEKITQVCWNILLILMLIVMTKDFW